MKKKTDKRIFGLANPKPWAASLSVSKPALLQLPEPTSQKTAQAKGQFARKIFEPIISRPIELDKLATEITLRLHGADGNREIRSCYGDIYKVINALMDYARLLELVCDEWDLQGYHRAAYELHAGKLRAIAKKYQTAIGYDYDAALAKCEKIRKKQHNTDDIGGDALDLAYKKSQREATKRRGDILW